MFTRLKKNIPTYWKIILRKQENNFLLVKFSVFFLLDFFNPFEFGCQAKCVGGLFLIFWQEARFVNKGHSSLPDYFASIPNVNRGWSMTFFRLFCENLCMFPLWYLLSHYVLWASIWESEYWIPILYERVGLL